MNISARSDVVGDGPASALMGSFSVDASSYLHKSAVVAGSNQNGTLPSWVPPFLSLRTDTEMKHIYRASQCVQGKWLM